MELKDIHAKLDKQCPSNYKINTIIKFAYPYRRVKIKIIANKLPEKSIQQLYTIFLKTINAGYNKEHLFIDFLGINDEDFILNELYFLKKKGYLDFSFGIWMVTEQGNAFINNNNILRILAEEEFEFLIDAINNEVLNKERSFNTYPIKAEDTCLKSEISFPFKSKELLNNRYEQLSEIYKIKNKGKSQLVDYDKSKILYDSNTKEYHNYFLIEYTPRTEHKTELEPYIEIRNTDDDLSKAKKLSKSLANKYPIILQQLTQ